MILFHKENTGYELKDKLKHKNWLKTVAKSYHTSIKDINYIFQSDAELLKLNQSHLDHDTLTDIITFDNRDEEGGPVEADIFISIDRIRENSENFKVSFETELRRVMAHGLLHLIGFGDKTNTEKTEMRAAEDRALETFKKL